MSPEEIAASQIKLNFTGVEEATGSNMTLPGTIAKFTISEANPVTAQEKGTPGLKVTFIEPEGSSFTHTFWLTTNSLTRVQHLAKHAIGKEFSGEITPLNVAASLKGKSTFLKVVPQFNAKNGRVYPDLPFGGFAGDTANDLTFNQRELGEIEKAKELTLNTKINNADAETSVSNNETSVQKEAEEF